MIAMVPVPQSQLDPYTPEKSNEKPVKIRLVFESGRVVYRMDGKRCLTTPRVPLRVQGCLFVYRGTEGDGSQVYREVVPLELDGLSKMQREYVSLSEKIANPKWEAAFYGDRAGISHGEAVVRKQAIAFHLVEEEIARVRKGE